MEGVFHFAAGGFAFLKPNLNGIALEPSISEYVALSLQNFTSRSSAKPRQ
jgi:hypothetical protein